MVWLGNFGDEAQRRAAPDGWRVEVNHKAVEYLQQVETNAGILPHHQQEIVAYAIKPTGFHRLELAEGKLEFFIVKGVNSVSTSCLAAWKSRKAFCFLAASRVAAKLLVQM